jgi:hypothetical protein
MNTAVNSGKESIRDSGLWEYRPFSKLSEYRYRSCGGGYAQVAGN